MKTRFSLPSFSSSDASNLLPSAEVKPLMMLVWPLVHSSFICGTVSFFFRNRPGKVCLQPFL